MNEPLSLNRYTYVSNNPVNFIDPTGHAELEDDNIGNGPTYVRDVGLYVDEIYEGTVELWSNNKTYFHSGGAVRSHYESQGYTVRWDNELGVLVYSPYVGGGGDNDDDDGEQDPGGGDDDNSEPTLEEREDDFNIYSGDIPGEIDEFFGFLFDEDQGIYYFDEDVFQKEVGYFDIYDEFVPALGMVLEFEIIEFEYDDKDWKIELWKGIYGYGLATGGEIGVYTEEFQLNTPYEELNDVVNENVNFGTNTATANEEDYLEMSFSLYKEEENELIFTTTDTTWWLTGFKPCGPTVPSELYMDIEITFDNPGMAAAFVGGLIDTGYNEGEIEQTGNTVGFKFYEPHTEQAEYYEHIFK